MRLRYLRLSNYPPIKNMAVRFASGSPLDRECAIRFVVGVNGSGKSNLLRAIAEIFLALVDLRMPQFPVYLVYELGSRDSSQHRTLILDCEGHRSEACLWLAENYYCPDDATVDQFAQAIDYLRANPTNPPVGFKQLISAGEWPSRASAPPQIALPNAVLAYTTGAMQPWQILWSRSLDAEGVELVSQGEGYDPSAERPAGWTVAQEAVLLKGGSAISSESANDAPAVGNNQNLFRRPMLLTPVLLKCALLAVALPQAFVETADYPLKAETDALMAKLRKRDNNSSPLQELLGRGGWHHLVSVAFRSRLQAKAWSRTVCETAHDWLLCAGEVIAEPHPTESRRTLFFDLKGQFGGQDVATLMPNDGLSVSTTQGEALWALLGGHEATAFELFAKLAELHQAGLFDDVDLRLRRQGKPAADADQSEQDKDIGVLRYEELSDGEQMVLGRMALFHLLQDQQDALLLLDEPETHFNDFWKRDVVSIVDDALGNTSCEVFIATHAALMLTDALKDELVVLERAQSDNAQQRSGTIVRSLDNDTHTFGATGDHPLRDIFGATDTVGRRASRLLGVLIAAASMTEHMNAYWAGEPHSRDDSIIDNLVQIAQVTESDLTRAMVSDNLNSIESFARYFGVPSPLQMKAVLESFIDQTGPGYFQVELKRAWYRLTREGAHAA